MSSEDIWHRDQLCLALFGFSPAVAVTSEQTWTSCSGGIEGRWFADGIADYERRGRRDGLSKVKFSRE